MEERAKHKIMIGIEVVLLCMIMTIIGTNAESSDPPSNGVSYSKNSQKTVEGALNDLYTKANYGNATASQILKGKTALVGGKQVTGTMTDWTGTPQHIDAVRLKDNQFQVAVASGYHGYSWAGNSYEYLTYTEVASKIGLTKEKLLKGQSVLGITGTGETTCPTPESLGYYKIKTFSDVKATVESYQTFNGNWKNLSYETYSSCSNGSCNSQTGKTTFKINLSSDLGISPTQILDYTLQLSCRGVSQGIRYGKGYTANSNTKEYWYPHSIVVSKSNGITIFNSSGTSPSSHVVEASAQGNSTIKMTFSSRRGPNTNGTTQGTYEVACTEFNLSGTIVYK